METLILIIVDGLLVVLGVIGLCVLVSLSRTVNRLREEKEVLQHQRDSARAGRDDFLEKLNEEVDRRGKIEEMIQKTRDVLQAERETRNAVGATLRNQVTELEGRLAAAQKDRDVMAEAWEREKARVKEEGLMWSRKVAEARGVIQVLGLKAAALEVEAKEALHGPEAEQG